MAAYSGRPDPQGQLLGALAASRFVCSMTG